ncbi:hypothetical protein PAMC26577_37640 [Caballeronia sordidicola]|uniref:Uncharacterized protein n=1 Tax=Caballeronia sordidicola TaxID=196367 RepID=A0A242M5Z6_CABSO|nr:hypothetical protein PAMC26577_37640 [Caballeronia sordidicola]
MVVLAGYFEKAKNAQPKEQGNYDGKSADKFGKYLHLFKSRHNFFPQFKVCAS